MVYYGERIAIYGDPDEKRCGFRAFESGSTAAFARFCVKNGKDRMFRTGGESFHGRDAADPDLQLCGGGPRRNF